MEGKKNNTLYWPSFASKLQHHIKARKWSVGSLFLPSDFRWTEFVKTLPPGDRATTYEDPRDLQTTYVRNGFGEIIQKTSPDSGTTVYVRNALGLATQETDARGVVANMSYDDGGRILSKTYPANSSENVAYTYDSTAGGNYGVGRLTGVTHEGGSITYDYDARGNVTQEVRTINGVGYAVAYDYDANDQIAQITYPSGRQVSYVRDAHNRITGVQTRKSPTDAWADVVSSIETQPFSTLLQSMDFANGLNVWNTFTQDHELDVLGLYDGSTDVINRAHGRTDALNLTNIWDNVATGQDQSYWYSAANRLQNADGPWGAKIFYYDGVGNRTYHISTPPGGSQSTDILGYAAASNRVEDVTNGAQTVRQFAYDAAGNIVSDARLGSTYAYGYNDANRLATVAYEGNLKGTYTYNADGQLIKRVITNSGSANGTLLYVHDRSGNVIAEVDVAAGVMREYLWLPGIGYTGTDLPIAVVEGAGGASPTTYYVHTDHLNRPIKMTDGTKTSVWNATWLPFGSPHAITGTLTETLRFPGQWFQLEAGLHYNWHRHYDPSLGRYTQPDPLGFVDGASVYSYVGSKPMERIDFEGLFQMCRRPMKYLPGWRHCFMKFKDGSTLSFDGSGVHSDPQPDHPERKCTKPKDSHLDKCLKKEMKKCKNYNHANNNCCRCVRQALAACKTSVPPDSFPKNWPFNGPLNW